MASASQVSRCVPRSLAENSKFPALLTEVLGNYLAIMNTNGADDQALAALEDELDLALLAAAREANEYVSWEQAKQELGLR